MLDINSQDFIQNPYPYFAKMRNLDQPFRLPMNEDFSSKGIWLFSNYADAMVIFKESNSASKNLQAVKEKSNQTCFDLHLLNRDGAEHLRLRRLVADYFTSQSSQKLAALMQTICDQLIQSILKQEQVDLVHDYATPLPLQIIAKIMGIPNSEYDLIRVWTKAIMIDSLKLTDDIKQQRKVSISEFIDYISRLINENHFKDGHGLIGQLLIVEKEGNISRDEIVGMAIFLLVAGHETTIDLIGNALYLLLANQEQLVLLRQNPSLLPSAIDEVLRYESPTQRTTYRVTTSKMEFSNFVVEAGEQIAVFIGSANRDKKVFKEPESFDIQRNPNPQIAFGMGVHNCLGRHLAKVEAEIAISTFIKHLSHAQLVQLTPVWKNSSFLRGLSSLPVYL
jgi:cytochrome P450